MTDANGTSNQQNGSQSLRSQSLRSQSLTQNGSSPQITGSQPIGQQLSGQQIPGQQIPGQQNSPNQSPDRLSSASAPTNFTSASGTFIERPKLNIPSSQFLPNASGTHPSTADKLSGQPPLNSVRERRGGDKPRTRSRTTEDPKTRRTRKPRNQSHSQGSTQNTERRRLFGTVPDRIKSKSSSRTKALKARTGRPADKKPVRLLKKTSGSPTPLNPSKSATGKKQRPDLPNPAHPGRVPPSRGLVRKRRRSSNKYVPLIRRGIQFLVVSLGIALIGGTLLKVVRPGDSAPATEAVDTVVAEPTPVAKSFPLTLGQEIPALKASLQELPNLYPGLTPKIFYIDVDTKQHVSVEGSETIAAASTIKLPILLAFFEEIDAGRIDPNQKMAVQQPQIAEGSGDMQLSAPGTQFTALEVASQMIINSDNTATNMMIDLLGGKEILNSRFLAQGLEKTKLNAPLPDLDGTNTTSAEDLVHTMLLISQGEDLKMRSRDRILNILNRTYNKSLLADGPLQEGALTYNKTGDIQSVLGDVALIDLPNGKRYVIAALVERPSNDGRAQELIRRISGQTYQEAAKAIQPAVTPLGNPDGEPSDTVQTPGINPTSNSTDAPNGADTTPAEEVFEEAPYPSANPNGSASSNSSAQDPL